MDLEIMDVDGRAHAIEVVLDTGFTGSLSLPTYVVDRLGLRWVGQRTFELANGEFFDFDVYLTAVRWHGFPTDALALRSDSAPLLGMTLLWGSRIMVEASHGGEVTIEEIEPIDAS